MYLQKVCKLLWNNVSTLPEHSTIQNISFSSFNNNSDMNEHRVWCFSEIYMLYSCKISLKNIRQSCTNINHKLSIRNNNSNIKLSSYMITDAIYRVIQELLQLTELISDDILSKMCRINLGPILSIYRVMFVFGFFLNFNFNVNYKLHNLNAFVVTKTN
jgi:hypothetical protein